MSQQPRTPYYVPLGASAFAVVSLDSGHYTPTLAAKLGFVTAAPAATVSTAVMSIRAIKKSGLIANIKLNCISGTGDTKKRRSVPLICATTKAASIVTEAKAEVVKLGGGSAGATWTVDSVTV
jgi:hypothetical protein